MIQKLLKRIFKVPNKPKDDVWTRMRLLKALRQNGITTEKAKRERRSLSRVERNIITAIRQLAKDKGFSVLMINAEEMDGERDMEAVTEPYKVKAKFAYYSSPYYGHSVADASYHIIESNHPVLILHGNFGEEELMKYNVKIPKHPTFNEWDKKGRKCFRG